MQLHVKARVPPLSKGMGADTKSIGLWWTVFQVAVGDRCCPPGPLLASSLPLGKAVARPNVTDLLLRFLLSVVVLFLGLWFIFN